MKGPIAPSRLIVRLVVGAALIGICVFGAASASAATPRGYLAENGWQYLELGVYPQTLEAGLEPILWRILSVEDNSAYLVSESVLFHHRLDADDVAYALNGGDFTQTELCAYLNGAFSASFTADELALVQEDKAGRFTLLSADDLRNGALGFGSNGSRKAYGTAYALRNGLFQYSQRYGGASPYWTLSQSGSSEYAALCTKAAGNLGWIRVVVQNLGCRPACRITLDSASVLHGSGTKIDPFRFSFDK